MEGLGRLVPRHRAAQLALVQVPVGEGDGGDARHGVAELEPARRRELVQQRLRVDDDVHQVAQGGVGLDVGDRGARGQLEADLRIGRRLLFVLLLIYSSLVCL